MGNEQFRYNKAILGRSWYQHFATQFLVVVGLLYIAAAIPISFYPELGPLLLKGQLILALFMACLYTIALQLCRRSKGWKEELKVKLQVPMEEDEEFLKYLKKRNALDLLQSQQRIDRTALKAYRTLFLTGKSFNQSIKSSHWQGGSLMAVGFIPCAYLLSGAWVTSKTPTISINSLLLQFAVVAIVYIVMYTANRRTFLRLSEKIAAEVKVDLPSLPSPTLTEA